MAGHKTKAALEDSTAIEEQDGASSALVKSVLKPPQPETRRVLNLVKYVILPKGEDRHQICPRGRQERGCVERQESTIWYPSLLKGRSEQELEQRTKVGGLGCVPDLPQPWDLACLRATVRLL